MFLQLPPSILILFITSKETNISITTLPLPRFIYPDHLLKVRDFYPSSSKLTCLTSLFRKLPPMQTRKKTAAGPLTEKDVQIDFESCFDTLADLSNSTFPIRPYS